MASTLRHRGPDGDGYLLAEQVALGHRRLSIIDLAGGDQPIFNEDGSVAVVFNGEIYNYKELRAELIRAGHQFTTHSDTEVIVHLYEEDGPALVNRLNGMFAFALWDTRKRSLMLARDRLGEKPLYYSLTPRGLAFASELKALRQLDLGSDALAVRSDALDDYFAYGYVPAPKSMFRGIEKLPAASFAIYEGGKLKVRQYWSIDYAAAPMQATDEQSWLEELNALLLDSIRIRLRADVPVGAFLSGGIDSSLVVALAAQLSERPLMTFCVAFNDADFDESPYARALAQRYRTEHHEILVSDASLDILPQLVAQFDEPFADPSALPTYYVTREARRHVKVCLSGDGGDELFGGYTRYAAEPLERSVRGLSPALRRALFGTAARLLPQGMKGRGWLERLGESGARRHQLAVGVFSPRERRALLRPEFSRDVDETAWLLAPAFRDTSVDEAQQRMLADQASYLPDDILAKVDRDSMLNSLEVRVPFLDHRLVEFANSLPLAAKICNGVQKFLPKELLRTLDLAAVAERRKHGFGLPLAAWLNNERAREIDELLLSSDSRCHAFLRPESIRGWLDRSRAAGRDFGARIWSLTWFEHWCRQFGVS